MALKAERKEGCDWQQTFATKNLGFQQPEQNLVGQKIRKP
jgi:hypothetical protein